jgi:hypothetical protein
LGIDIVLECSGKFLTRAALQPMLDAGAKVVVVSAPMDDKTKAVLNVVYGVNHKAYDKEDPIVTAASCTTNCLAPVVKVIHETFGVRRIGGWWAVGVVWRDRGRDAGAVRSLPFSPPPLPLASPHRSSAAASPPSTT